MNHRIPHVGRHKAYRSAVERAFGREIDYAMLVKIYGNQGADGGAHRRYSPGTFNGSERIVVSGAPNLDKISTSYAERTSPSVCDAPLYPPHKRFLKEAGEPSAMVALFMMYYAAASTLR